MTRLMQVMAGAEHGGAEAFFMRLAPALQDAGVGQEIIIRSNRSRSETLRRCGLSVAELPFGGPLDLISGHMLRRAVRRYRPEILLSWMNRATQFCPIGPHRLVARLGGYYKVGNYRHCDHLIANTEDIRSYLLESGWPESRVTYVPNFVESAPSAPISRAEFDTPDGAPLILALGRLHENKAFDVLIAALAQISGSYLWIAGDGPLRRALMQQTATAGLDNRVRFLGWRDDAPALLASCDILVCPSRHEPLGNVVLEGWAHKRPVVAASADGPRSLIDDRSNGLLVPVDDSDALANALHLLAENAALREDVAQKGWETYTTQFSKDIVVARYLSFFEKVTA